MDIKSLKIFGQCKIIMNKSVYRIFNKIQHNGIK